MTLKEIVPDWVVEAFCNLVVTALVIGFLAAAAAIYGGPA